MKITNWLFKRKKEPELKENEKYFNDKDFYHVNDLIERTIELKGRLLDYQTKKGKIREGTTGKIKK